MSKIPVRNEDCPCVIVFQGETIVENIRCLDGDNAESQFIDTFKHYGGNPDLDDETKSNMLEEGRAIIPDGFVFLSWAM